MRYNGSNRTAITKSSKLQVINLSDKVLTEDQIEVLGLGLNLGPAASFYVFTATKDLHLFSQKITSQT